MRAAIVMLATLAVGSNPPTAYTPYVSLALYGAGYAAEPQQQPAPAPAEQQPEWAKRLESKLDRLIKLLEDAARPDDDPPPERDRDQPRGNNADPLASAAEKCASCHGPAASDRKGGKFVLFEEQRDGLHFRQLSARELRNTVREVREGTMPPKDDPRAPKLSAAERRALLDLLDPPKK